MVCSGTQTCGLGVPLLFTEEFEVVIMIAVRDRRGCMGRTESTDLKTNRSEPWLERRFSYESEMALLSECMR
jgi:hypothetical protein